jgi:hypothetical protein
MPDLAAAQKRLPHFWESGHKAHFVIMIRNGITDSGSWIVLDSEPHGGESGPQWTDPWFHLAVLQTESLDSNMRLACFDNNTKK